MPAAGRQEACPTPPAICLGAESHLKIRQNARTASYSILMYLSTSTSMTKDREEHSQPRDIRSKDVVGQSFRHGLPWQRFGVGSHAQGIAAGVAADEGVQVACAVLVPIPWPPAMLATLPGNSSMKQQLPLAKQFYNYVLLICSGFLNLPWAIVSLALLQKSRVVSQPLSGYSPQDVPHHGAQKGTLFFCACKGNTGE